MSIFDFFKKNKQAQSTGSQSVQMKTPIDFYTDCVQDFHKTAMAQGTATKGVILIPELLPIGEKAVLGFLRDPYFQMRFSGNPQLYYHLIMSLSLQAGIVFADKWHKDYESLKSGYVDQIIEEGPVTVAMELLESMFPENISANHGDPFCKKIFARWLVMHEPYWKLSDPRDYTFKAMLAAYQLGVSMMLEKYGY